MPAAIILTVHHDVAMSQANARDLRTRQHSSTAVGLVHIYLEIV